MPADQPFGDERHGDEASSGEFERLSRELGELRDQIRDIDARLARLESAPQKTEPPRAKPPRGKPPVDEEAEIIEASSVEEAEQPAGEESREAQRPAASVAQQPEPQQRESKRGEAEPSRPLQERLAHAQQAFSEQWEDVVGGRWLTWAGALTLIVAMAFFVPWAWTELDLPDWSKVLMLHLLGAGVSIAAYVLHCKEMKVFAQGLAGVGIFTLYASAWAAQHHYGIWGEAGELITFLECASITAVAIAAAVSSRSVAIVLLGALGGYLTPIIASSGSGNHIALFSYLAFLNVALVGSSVMRGWSFLKPIALVATVVMFTAWLESGAFDAEVETWSTQWLLTLHGGIFLLGATLPPVLWQRRSDWFDLAALTANSLWFVGTTWSLFHERPEQQLTLVCWGMTVLHLGLFGATYNRVTNIDRMPRVHLALSAIFFILAMPLQLEDSLSYLALAWAAQGAALAAVGIYFRDRQMCVTSLIVYGLSAMRLLAFDYPDDPETLGGVDRRFVMFTASSLLMIVGGALYPLTGRLLRKRRENALFWEPAGGALMAAGNLLAMIGLTCQWDGRLILLLWTIDAAAIWAAGFALRRFQVDGMPVRTYGMLLAVVLVGGRALYHGDEIDGPFALLVNDRFGTLLLMSAVYFTAAWAYRAMGAKRSGKERSALDLTREKLLDPALAVLASAVLMVALSLEIRSWFDAALDAGRRPFANMRMAEQAAYSILWSVYAAVAVVVGFVLRWPVLRYVGLAGFGVTLVKVFFIDLAELELLARVLALAVLGLMLLAVSFIYQRFAAKLKASS